ncbi:nucleoid-associated protein [Treponema parvum]|uniref:Nucleoid-associated protein n=1 Tax=Treponema parvum TaxID=138851 RepID=A0A975F5A1_9SPIR|nr:nucleoid-associated protein [Treponema parvum]QTQ14642.1 nucleoid-associated protein [Treponema parvum]
MLYTEYLSIKKLILHITGNKLNQDNIILSTDIIEINPDMEKNLISYFLTPFDSEEFYQFYHESDLALNEVYTYVSKIFDNGEQLYEQSVNLAKHLYEQSTHPKIKGGEFYTVYFKDCILDSETLDAVGLFKSENKDTFLKVLQENDNFNLQTEKGINIKKLDKGCLIFNKDRENGYIVAVVDNAGRGVEARYWLNDFLHVCRRKDEYTNTQNFMTLAKNFVTQELPKELGTSKADQIDLLNKSLDFFKDKDTCDIDDFTNEVMIEPDIIEKFYHYKQRCEDESGTSINNSFSISETARKKQQRSFKRVIQLDKKIKIVIDGNSQNIEQGTDKKGKFYKVYYNEEK